MRPTLLIFQASVPPNATLPERLVGEAWNAATLDTLLSAAHSHAFERAILVTEDPALISAATAFSSSLDGLPLHIEPAPHSKIQNPKSKIQNPKSEGFHFGDNLQAICTAHNLDRVVYTGGGSMPLATPATPATLYDLALSISNQPCVVSNNLYSADIIAFYPASALSNIVLPANDNDLAWLLHYRAGLPHATTPKTLAVNFDIDTPTDLATLHLATQSAPLDRVLGPHLRAFLSTVPAALPALTQSLELAYRAMSTRRAQVLLAGRVSSWTWRRLETNLPCQTRIFSEERGMRASGREARGEVRSLLGLYADLAGIDGLIDALQQTSDAAFLDTRVLFAHRRLSPTRPDRFASDALLPTLITDPWIRELTEAAISTPMPIVLGGHSLISGGVWALSERVRGSGSGGGG